MCNLYLELRGWAVFNIGFLGVSMRAGMEDLEACRSWCTALILEVTPLITKFSSRTVIPEVPLEYLHLPILYMLGTPLSDRTLASRLGVIKLSQSVTNGLRLPSAVSLRTVLLMYRDESSLVSRCFSTHFHLKHIPP